MRRTAMILLLCVVLFASTSFSFDLEKTKANYSGAVFEVAAIKEMLYENAPAVAVSFTVPLNKELLEKDQITISGGQYDHWILSDDRTKIIFPFVNPETEYRVHVSNLIQDIMGQSLKYPQTQTLETSKLIPSVNFASSGHILSSSSPKYLPVSTLNVDEVTIQFFHIDQDKIPTMISVLRRNGQDGYYAMNRIQEYGKLVHTGRFPLNPRKNQRTEFNIDLQKIKALRPSGAYVAVMSQPGVFTYDFEHAFFMQTNIGVHIRKYENSFDVYAQDITSGLPLKNIDIEIANTDGEIINKGKTNGLGTISFHNQSKQHHLIATSGDQLSVLYLNQNALDLSALKNAQTIHSEFQIFSWGPRNLYRPGENIGVDILVRDFDGRLPAGMPLQATLLNPDGSEISTVVLQPKSTGFYQFSYKTGNGCQTGPYTLNFTFAEDNTADYKFLVEEFLPERLNLDIFDGQPEKRLMASPLKIKVPVHSDYLYGAPAAFNKVDGFIVADVDQHPFKDLKTFFFGDKRERLDTNQSDFSSIFLDEEGSGVLTMPNKWRSSKSPMRLLVNASVYETGGRPVTRSSLLTLLNTDNFIGIEPQFKGRPDSDTTVDFKIGYANEEGQWQQGKNLQLKLIHNDRRWYWHHTDSRGWHWAWDDDPVTVFSKSIKTEKGTTTTVSVPIAWGSYVLEVSDGNATSSYEFKTSWSWWNNTVSESSHKPDLVSLGFEKTTYKPGETATLRINPPQDGMALVTVESSDRVLFTQFMPVESGGTLVDIITDPSWTRHDLYASVMVIRPGDMKKTPVPTRAFGMIHLPLKRENTEFAVTIKAPESTPSGRTISADIHLESKNGVIPTNTKVVVALVDVGILNITRYNTPDAEAYFFGARRYNIDLFDNYGQVIDNIGPKAVRQRFGGDFVNSDDDLTRGGEKPKSDVQMVSFFSDPLAVDSAGNATASFELPNFNGRLRWMVMAYADDQFGSGDFDSKIADKVVTQIAMPRFLAKGDKSTVALDMHNMSGQRQDFTVKINLSGAFEARTETQFITLDNKDKTTLRFPITADSSKGQGVVSIHLTGSSTSASAAVDMSRTWKLGVRSPFNSITRKTSQSISAGKKWKPSLKTDDLVAESIQVQLNVSNRPPIDMQSHFRYLMHYPYGCLEQSVSSGYPWVLASSLMVDVLGLSPQIEKQFNHKYDENFRMQQIQSAIQLVTNRLKSNGGFGLWSSDSPEDKWLTVYAAEFLNNAKDAGGGINAATTNKISKRLHKYLTGNSGTAGNRWSQDPDHYEFAYRSYAAYVLANHSSARLSELRLLKKTYEGKTDDDGLSWMYLAAAFKKAGDTKNAQQSFKYAMEQWERLPSTYYGEYGSLIRDLSRIIDLSILHGFDTDNNLVMELSSAVKNRRWLSTQERIALFRLSLTLAKDKGKTWSANLVTRQGKQSVEQSGVFNSVFNLDKYKSLTAVQGGSETLYASATLVGTPRKAPAPVSNGMTITRTFYDIEGRKFLPSIMKSGELAIVSLEISATNNTPDALVVDMLPAGMEIENQNLGMSSINLDHIRIDGKEITEIVDTSAIKHVEFRDDRFVAALDVKDYDSVRLFYLVRAVTPGVYKVPGSYVEDMYRPYRNAIGASYKTLTVTE